MRYLTVSRRAAIFSAANPHPLNIRVDQFSINFIDLDIDCPALIQLYDRDLEQVVQGNADYQARRVWRRSIPVDSQLAATLIQANDLFYNFDIDGTIECYFARYDQGCHYSALHWDCQPNEPHQRKLSFSLELNEGFKGGELITHRHESMITRPGRLMVFPSYLVHGVTEVTEGTRFVIFGFMSGPHWR